jgi:hypothetical protein
MRDISNRICLRSVKAKNDMYTNDRGYTVLDNFMLTILKSHSTATMDQVDDGPDKGTQYAGIEVDICGSWMADSPCFQSLIEAGRPSIPPHWKHKFCNTSVQAICHCMTIMGAAFTKSKTKLWSRATPFDGFSASRTINDSAALHFRCSLSPLRESSDRLSRCMV